MQLKWCEMKKKKVFFPSLIKSPGVERYFFARCGFTFWLDCPVFVWFFLCMFSPSRKSRFGPDFSLTPVWHIDVAEEFARKKEKNNSPQGSGEDILEGPELWEFSVKAFQNDSSSTSLNTWSILACWMEWIPLSYCSAVWLSPCYFFPQLQQ